MFKLTTIPAALLIGVLWSSTAHAQRDQVFGERGTPTTGTITEVTPTTVTVQVGTTSRSFPVNEVQRINLDGEPAELRRAREAMQQGRYEDVRAELAKIVVADIRRELVKQDVEYYKGLVEARLALTTGGDKAAAHDALYNFVRTNPQSYHFYEAAEVLGDLAVAVGKYEDAARYYAALAKAPWPEYKLRASLLEARPLSLAGQWQPAQQRYDTVLSASLDTPAARRMKLMATIGRARAVAELGNPQEGVAALQEIIAKQDPSDIELFSRAYNALGACYLKGNQPKEALLAYLHVDVLFFAIAEEHAEALLHLSQLWSEMNKSDRAVQARTLLQSRYAGTLWARQL